MFDFCEDDVFAVYNHLKDKYPLIMTTTGELTVDCPILVGNAHGQIIELYEDDGLFVLDIMDETKTKGTHFHPIDVEMAVKDIVRFMEGKSDYELHPFKL